MHAFAHIAFYAIDKRWRVMRACYHGGRSGGEVVLLWAGHGPASSLAQRLSHLFPKRQLSLRFT